MRAIAEKRRHAGPIDIAEDRLAAIPIEAKKDRKKKSLHTMAALENGFQKFFSWTSEFRRGATTAIKAQALPGMSRPTKSSTRFASSTMKKVETNSGIEVMQYVLKFIGVDDDN